MGRLRGEDGVPVLSPLSKWIHLECVSGMDCTVRGRNAMKMQSQEEKEVKVKGNGVRKGRVGWRKGEVVERVDFERKRGRAGRERRAREGEEGRGEWRRTEEWCVAL